MPLLIFALSSSQRARMRLLSKSYHTPGAPHHLHLNFKNKIFARLISLKNENRIKF